MSSAAPRGAGAEITYTAVRKIIVLANPAFGQLPNPACVGSVNVHELTSRTTSHWARYRPKPVALWRLREDL
ncbi:hypothetical protein GCM10010270_06090 [Streptomyces violaceus]|nr:hypothetical protein GCM10010270_06090 [Streptomyces janthinus]